MQIVISPKQHSWKIDVRGVWQYKDLLILFVRRDFIAQYKQTVLGPIWFFIQPILTTLMYIIIFNKVANIDTGGIPMILFYLSGVVAWNYFADCVIKTSSVYRDNSGIFGKVYFPRVIIPLSIIISNLIKFGVQFLLFVIVYIMFWFKGLITGPNIYILTIPFLLLLMASIGLGIGMLVTALTTKYRDLYFFISFGVQLLMYATPVVYPLSILNGHVKDLILLNPLTLIMEIFRYGFFGLGTISLFSLFYSIIFTLVLLFFGMMLFNKTEQDFMDTV